MKKFGLNRMMRASASKSFRRLLAVICVLALLPNSILLSTFTLALTDNAADSGEGSYSGDASDTSSGSDTSTDSGAHSEFNDADLPDLSDSNGALKSDNTSMLGGRGVFGPENIVIGGDETSEPDDNTMDDGDEASKPDENTDIDEELVSQPEDEEDKKDPFDFSLDFDGESLILPIEDIPDIEENFEIIQAFLAPMNLDFLLGPGDISLSADISAISGNYRTGAVGQVRLTSGLNDPEPGANAVVRINIPDVTGMDFPQFGKSAGDNSFTWPGGVTLVLHRDNDGKPEYLEYEILSGEIIIINNLQIKVPSGYSADQTKVEFSASSFEVDLDKSNFTGEPTFTAGDALVFSAEFNWNEVQISSSPKTTSVTALSNGDLTIGDNITYAVSALKNYSQSNGVIFAQNYEVTGTITLPDGLNFKSGSLALDATKKTISLGGEKAVTFSEPLESAEINGNVITYVYHRENNTLDSDGNPASGKTADDLPNLDLTVTLLATGLVTNSVDVTSLVGAITHKADFSVVPCKGDGERTSNRTASTSVTVPEPSFTITKTNSPANSTTITSTSEKITYKLSVKNTGISTQSNLTVTDDISSLPLNFTGSSDVKTPSGAVFNGNVGGVVTWTITSIEPNETKTFEFQVTVKSGTGINTTITNKAQLKYGATTISSNNVSNVFDDSDKITILKTSSVSTVTMGDTIPYTITVRNTSSLRTSAGIKVVDQLPEGVHLVGSQITALTSAYSNAAYNAATRTITISNISLNPSQTLTFTFTATLSGGPNASNPSTPYGDNVAIPNKAELFGEGGQLLGSSTANVQHRAKRATVNVSKTYSNLQENLGAADNTNNFLVDYTVTVTNTGEKTEGLDTPLYLIDSMSGGARPAGAGAASSGTITGQVSGGGTLSGSWDRSGNSYLITWNNLPILEKNQTYTITYKAEIPVTYNADGKFTQFSVTNRAQVKGSVNGDPSASTTFTIKPSVANVVVAKSNNGTQKVANSNPNRTSELYNIDYTITLTNKGERTNTIRVPLSFTDTMAGSGVLRPNGATGSEAVGSTGTITGTTNRDTTVTGTWTRTSTGYAITWPNIPVLDKNEAYSITYKAVFEVGYNMTTLRFNTATQATNTVNVKGSADGTLSANSSVSVTQKLASVSISKTNTGAVKGSDINANTVLYKSDFTVTVTNGALKTDDLRVPLYLEDVMSGGLRPGNATGNEANGATGSITGAITGGGTVSGTWTYNATGKTYTIKWNIPELNANQVLKFTYTGNVSVTYDSDNSFTAVNAKNTVTANGSLTSFPAATSTITIAPEKGSVSVNKTSANLEWVRDDGNTAIHTVEYTVSVKNTGVATSTLRGEMRLQDVMYNENRYVYSPAGPNDKTTGGLRPVAADISRGKITGTITSGGTGTVEGTFTYNSTNRTYTIDWGKVPNLAANATYSIKYTAEVWADYEESVNYDFFKPKTVRNTVSKTGTMNVDGITSAYVDVTVWQKLAALKLDKVRVGDLRRADNNAPVEARYEVDFVISALNVGNTDTSNLRRPLFFEDTMSGGLRPIDTTGRNVSTGADTGTMKGEVSRWVPSGSSGSWVSEGIEVVGKWTRSQTADSKGFYTYTVIWPNPDTSPSGLSMMQPNTQYAIAYTGEIVVKWESDNTFVDVNASNRLTMCGSWDGNWPGGGGWPGCGGGGGNPGTEIPVTPQLAKVEVTKFSPDVVRASDGVNNTTDDLYTLQYKIDVINKGENTAGVKEKLYIVDTMSGGVRPYGAGNNPSGTLNAQVHIDMLEPSIQVTGNWMRNGDGTYTITWPKMQDLHTNGAYTITYMAEVPVTYDDRGLFSNMTLHNTAEVKGSVDKNGKHISDYEFILAPTSANAQVSKSVLGDPHMATGNDELFIVDYQVEVANISGSAVPNNLKVPLYIEDVMKDGVRPVGAGNASSGSITAKAYLVTGIKEANITEQNILGSPVADLTGAWIRNPDNTYTIKWNTIPQLPGGNVNNEYYARYYIRYQGEVTVGYDANGFFPDKTVRNTVTLRGGTVHPTNNATASATIRQKLAEIVLQKDCGSNLDFSMQRFDRPVGNNPDLYRTLFNITLTNNGPKTDSLKVPLYIEDVMGNGARPFGAGDNATGTIKGFVHKSGTAIQQVYDPNYRTDVVEGTWTRSLSAPYTYTIKWPVPESMETGAKFTFVYDVEVPVEYDENDKFETFYVTNTATLKGSIKGTAQATASAPIQQALFTVEVQKNNFNKKKVSDDLYYADFRIAAFMNLKSGVSTSRDAQVYNTTHEGIKAPVYFEDVMSGGLRPLNAGDKTSGTIDGKLFRYDDTTNTYPNMGNITGNWTRSQSAPYTYTVIWHIPEMPLNYKYLNGVYNPSMSYGYVYIDYKTEIPVSFVNGTFDPFTVRNDALPRGSVHSVSGIPYSELTIRPELNIQKKVAARNGQPITSQNDGSVVLPGNIVKYNITLSNTSDMEYSGTLTDILPPVLSGSSFEWVLNKNVFVSALYAVGNDSVALNNPVLQNGRLVWNNVKVPPKTYDEANQTLQIEVTLYYPTLDFNAAFGWPPFQVVNTAEYRSGMYIVRDSTSQTIQDLVINYHKSADKTSIDTAPSKTDDQKTVTYTLSDFGINHPAHDVSVMDDLGDLRNKFIVKNVTRGQYDVLDANGVPAGYSVTFTFDDYSTKTVNIGADGNITGGTWPAGGGSEIARLVAVRWDFGTVSKLEIKQNPTIVAQAVNNRAGRLVNRMYMAYNLRDYASVECPVELYSSEIITKTLYDEYGQPITDHDGENPITRVGQTLTYEITFTNTTSGDIDMADDIYFLDFMNALGLDNTKDFEFTIEHISNDGSTSSPVRFTDHIKGFLSPRFPCDILDEGRKVRIEAGAVWNNDLFQNGDYFTFAITGANNASSGPYTSPDPDKYYVEFYPLLTIEGIMEQDDAIIIRYEVTVGEGIKEGVEKLDSKQYYEAYTYSIYNDICYYMPGLSTSGYAFSRSGTDWTVQGFLPRPHVYLDQRISIVGTGYGLPKHLAQDWTEGNDRVYASTSAMTMYNDRWSEQYIYGYIGNDNFRMKGLPYQSGTLSDPQALTRYYIVEATFANSHDSIGTFTLGENQIEAISAPGMHYGGIVEDAYFRDIYSWSHADAGSFYEATLRDGSGNDFDLWGWEHPKMQPVLDGTGLDFNSGRPVSLAYLSEGPTLAPGEFTSVRMIFIEDFENRYYDGSSYIEQIGDSDKITFTADFSSYGGKVNGEPISDYNLRDYITFADLGLNSLLTFPNNMGPLYVPYSNDANVGKMLGVINKSIKPCTVTSEVSIELPRSDISIEKKAVEFIKNSQSVEQWGYGGISGNRFALDGNHGSPGPEDVIVWEVKVTNEGNSILSNFNLLDLAPRPYHVIRADIGHYVEWSSLDAPTHGAALRLPTFLYHRGDQSVVHWEEGAPYFYGHSSSEQDLNKDMNTGLQIIPGHAGYDPYLEQFSYGAPFELTQIYFRSQGISDKTINTDRGLWSFMLAGEGAGFLLDGYDNYVPGSLLPGGFITIKFYTIPYKNVDIASNYGFINSFMRQGEDMPYSSYDNEAYIFAPGQVLNVVKGQPQPLRGVRGEQPASDQIVGGKAIGEVNIGGTLAAISEARVEFEDQSSNGKPGSSPVLIDPENSFTYTMEITNKSQTGFSNIVVIDRLPTLGDKGTSNISRARGSQFKAVPTGITPEVWLVDGATGGSEKIDAGKYALEYKVDTPDNAASAAFSTEDWSGYGNGSGWKAWDSGATEATAIRVTFNGAFGSLPGNGSKLQIKFDAKASGTVGVYAGMTAWNSFAFQYKAKDTDTQEEFTLRAEPTMVGVRVKGAKLAIDKKVDENGNPLSNVVFNVYTDQACTQPAYMYNGSARTLATMTTDINGYAVLPYNLLRGIYWVKEVQAPSGYLVSSTAYRVDISNAGNGKGEDGKYKDGIVVKVNDVDITNTRTALNLIITKTFASGTQYPGGSVTVSVNGTFATPGSSTRSVTFSQAECDSGAEKILYNLIPGNVYTLTVSHTNYGDYSRTVTGSTLDGPINITLIPSGSYTFSIDKDGRIDIVSRNANPGMLRLRKVLGGMDYGDDFDVNVTGKFSDSNGQTVTRTYTFGSQAGLLPLNQYVEIEGVLLKETYRITEPARVLNRYDGTAVVEVRGGQTPVQPVPADVMVGVDNADVTLTNTPKAPGDLKLTKRMDNGGVALQPATGSFTVTVTGKFADSPTVSNSKNYTLNSANGYELTVEGRQMIYGEEYRVEETSVSEGFEPLGLYLNGASQPSVFDNLPADVTFTAYSSARSVYIYNKPVDTFTLEVNKVVTQNHLNDRASFAFILQGPQGINSKRYNGSIDTSTGGVVNWSVGSTNKAVLDLAPGIYTLEESLPADSNYTLEGFDVQNATNVTPDINNRKLTFTANANNEVEITVTNGVHKANLRVAKIIYDVDGVERAAPAVEELYIGLYDVNGNTLVTEPKILVWDDDGYEDVVFENMGYGVYRVYELVKTGPDIYQKVSEVPFPYDVTGQGEISFNAATISAASTNPHVTIVNRERSTSDATTVNFQKIFNPTGDIETARLANTEFVIVLERANGDLISNEHGRKIEVVLTGSNPSKTLNLKLPMGEYVVAESEDSNWVNAKLEVAYGGTNVSVPSDGLNLDPDVQPRVHFTMEENDMNRDMQVVVKATNRALSKTITSDNFKIRKFVDSDDLVGLTNEERTFKFQLLRGEPSTDEGGFLIAEGKKEGAGEIEWFVPGTGTLWNVDTHLWIIGETYYIIEEGSNYFTLTDVSGGTKYKDSEILKGLSFTMTSDLNVVNVIFTNARNDISGNNIKLKKIVLDADGGTVPVEKWAPGSEFEFIVYKDEAEGYPVARVVVNNSTPEQTQEIYAMAGERILENGTYYIRENTIAPAGKYKFLALEGDGVEPVAGKDGLYRFTAKKGTTEYPFIITAKNEIGSREFTITKKLVDKDENPLVTRTPLQFVFEITELKNGVAQRTFYQIVKVENDSEATLKVINLLGTDYKITELQTNWRYELITSNDVEQDITDNPEFVFVNKKANNKWLDSTTSKTNNLIIYR